jgi:hypothetical protein
VALQSGIPREIIERAEEIGQCFAKGIPIQALDCEAMTNKRERSMQIAEAFIHFDVQKGDVEKFLNEVLHRD